MHKLLASAGAVELSSKEVCFALAHTKQLRKTDHYGICALALSMAYLAAPAAWTRFFDSYANCSDKLGFIAVRAIVKA
jgi:hypothetical protein